MLRASQFILPICCLSVAAASWYTATAVVVYAVPRQVMDTIENRIMVRAGGWNQCRHNREYGPQFGTVARANPDSIVTSMAYDVRTGPVRISGITWPAYWSLSLYQHNSDNYFTLNDQQLEAPQFDIAIVQAGYEGGPIEGARIVESPSDTGIMLIRRFVSTEDELEAVIANQDQMDCGPVADQSP